MSALKPARSEGSTAGDVPPAPGAALRGRLATQEGGTPPAACLSLHLILVGLPGSGKTTRGRHLAQNLSRPFTDFDEAL